MVFTDKNTKENQEEADALKIELIAIKKELVFQKEEKTKRATELVIAKNERLFQKEEKTKRAAELVIAKKELVFQKEEKKKRAAELVIAKKERLFQKEEKTKRAAELVIAKKELVFQKEEKKKRAAELVIANKKLVFQKEEKTKRATELVIAKKERLFQKEEKTKRAAELVIAKKELVFQKEEKTKRAAELVIVKKERVFQKEEKTKRAAELVITNKELVFQKEENEEITKRTAELEIANRQLIDFCNVVSHNLRAPLVNIAILIDYLQESKDEDERKDLLKKTKLVTDHLNEVFNELVESVQIKQDTEIKSDKIILKDCLDRILIGFGSEIEAYEADIQINFNDVHEIYYPKKYIESILTNLISNTLKYKSPDRKPVVKIKLKKITGNIILSVADNGLGIDLIKHQDNLFKIRKTFHKHPDAKGFGLYLVKTQVEAIGGKIWATSIPNVGSTFFIKFKTQNT
jgi:signal transduction histidine kinase